MNQNLPEIIFRAVVTLILLIIALSLVTGCSTPGAYQSYLQAHAAAVKNQRPTLEIIAQEGQAITGLKSIRVYGPGVAPQQEKDNEWARVVSSGINVVGVVGGIVAAGRASEDLVNAVGGLGLTSTVTNTTTDNRTVDTHAITDSYNQTATPTVVNPVVVTQPAPTVVHPQVVVLP